MGKTDPSSLLNTIMAAARQDPKKSGVLSVLVILLAVMAFRLATGEKPSAARGGAAPAGASVQAGGTNASANSKKSPRASDYRANRSELSERANNVNQKIREWMNDPVKPVSRNLFAVKLEYFPVDGSRPAQSAKTAADGEFWGRLEKSLMIQADQRDKRDILLANYKSEASRLRLDSIIMGDHPKAMIDGKLVAEGDVVAQFRVLKIEPRRITIEREGIRLEIQMK